MLTATINPAAVERPEVTASLGATVEKQRLQRLRRLRHQLVKLGSFESLKQQFLNEDGTGLCRLDDAQEPTPEIELLKFDEPVSQQSTICEICGQTFRNLKGVLRHMEAYHNIPGSAIKRGSRTRFSCRVCELEFPARNQLFRHCVKNHPEEMKKAGKDDELVRQQRTCVQCGIRFDGFEQFVCHVKESHAGNYCDICFKTFQDSSFLSLHRRVHFGGNPFACDLCPKVFKTLQHVGEHRRGHTKDRPYQCSECPHGFSRIGDLNKHRKLRHTEEPSYQCQICPETFHSSSLFHRHKQKHLRGSETFPCELCGELLADGSERREHILTSHAEGRPFECKVCGKRFKLSGHLKAHTFTHSGVRGQRCDLCPAAFYLAGDLRRHLKTHSKATKTAPFFTFAPSALGTALTTPSVAALSTCSIFMAISTASGVPALTASLGLTNTLSSTPGMGAITLPVAAPSRAPSAFRNFGWTSSAEVRPDCGERGK